MELEKQLDHFRERIEEGITQWVPNGNTRPKVLHEAMNYSLKAGGKRLRPTLLLVASELYPKRADPIPAAVAIECLHTYSLIHDDLPSIDDSDLRRGLPSCHIQFNEATAVLAGDALLTHSLAVLADAYKDQPELATSLVGELSSAADSRRLIGGQMEDILAEDSDCSPEQLEYIHLNKTASLIQAALVMGVRLTWAETGQIRLAAELGRKIGLAYQIIDDILDATSDTETLGKTAGQDSDRKKNTYIKLHGLAQSRAKARELTAAAVEMCMEMEADTQFLTALIGRMEHRIN